MVPAQVPLNRRMPSPTASTIKTAAINHSQPLPAAGAWLFPDHQKPHVPGQDEGEGRDYYEFGCWNWHTACVASSDNRSMTSVQRERACCTELSRMRNWVSEFHQGYGMGNRKTPSLAMKNKRTVSLALSCASALAQHQHACMPEAVVENSWDNAKGLRKVGLKHNKRHVWAGAC